MVTVAALLLVAVTEAVIPVGADVAVFPLESVYQLTVPAVPLARWRGIYSSKQRRRKLCVSEPWISVGDHRGRHCRGCSFHSNHNPFVITNSNLGSKSKKRLGDQEFYRKPFLAKIVSLRETITPGNCLYGDAPDSRVEVICRTHPSACRARSTVKPLVVERTQGRPRGVYQSRRKDRIA